MIQFYPFQGTNHCNWTCYTKICIFIPQSIGNEKATTICCYSIIHVDATLDSMLQLLSPNTGFGNCV